MNTRERVLKEALNCVNGEREKQYGNPEDNFKRIATLWTDYINMSFKGFFEAHKIGGIILEPIDVAKMMILFKIARSNGDEDKLDNYIDILGYGACAAEIFESSEKTEKVLKKKEELGVQLADECKDCDYAEKCIGTGVCLKEEEEKRVENGEKILDNFADLVNARVRKKTEEKEKKWFDGCGAKKDKPDDKCNRKDCGQFDACMTAYIYNKTKEVSEAIDECMCENKIDYSSYLQSCNNISTYIALKSTRANIHPFDVVDQLISKGNAPTDMVNLLMTGKLNFDNITSYIDDVINELKKEDKK